MKRLTIFAALLLSVACITTEHGRRLQSRNVNAYLDWRIDVDAPTRDRVLGILKAEYFSGTPVRFVSDPAHKRWVTVLLVPGRPKMVDALGKAMPCPRIYPLNVAKATVWVEYVRENAVRFGADREQTTHAIAHAIAHEIGHTLGFDHKGPSCCVMSASGYMPMALGKVPVRWD